MNSSIWGRLNSWTEKNFYPLLAGAAATAVFGLILRPAPPKVYWDVRCYSGEHLIYEALRVEEVVAHNGGVQVGEGNEGTRITADCVITPH